MAFDLDDQELKATRILNGVDNEIEVEVCPVCYGRGFVPAGFYDNTGLTWVSTTTGSVTCRSCSGKGYIKL